MAARAHIVIPEDLLAEVDRVAGKRKRSQFVEEAICEKLAQDMVDAPLSETEGALASADYPEWETPEGASAWVSDRRKNDLARQNQKTDGQREG